MRPHRGPGIPASDLFLRRRLRCATRGACRVCGDGGRPIRASARPSSTAAKPKKGRGPRWRSRRKSVDRLKRRHAPSLPIVPPARPAWKPSWAPAMCAAATPSPTRPMLAGRADEAGRRREGEVREDVTRSHVARVEVRPVLDEGPPVRGARASRSRRRRTRACRRRGPRRATRSGLEASFGWADARGKGRVDGCAGLRKDDERTTAGQHRRQSRATARHVMSEDAKRKQLKRGRGTTPTTVGWRASATTTRWTTSSGASVARLWDASERWAHAASSALVAEPLEVSPRRPARPR